MISRLGYSCVDGEHNLLDAVAILHANSSILINRIGALSTTVPRIDQMFTNITRNAPDSQVAD